MKFSSCPNIVVILLILNTFSCSHASENVISQTDGPFFFTAEPVGQTKNEGEEVQLNCTLDREPPGVTYSWYKYESEKAVKNSFLEVDGRNINVLLENETAEELIFSSISRDDGGYYQCKVQSDSYSIVSSVAYIEVNYFDEPAAQIVPEEVQVDAHKEVLFLTCATFNSSPVVNVFWTKDGSRISNERMFIYPEDYIKKMEKITRGTLLILNVDPDEDSGTYQCHSEKSKEFPEIKLLSEYRVNVDNSAVNQVTEKKLETAFTSLKDEQEQIYVESGGTVTLACAATGNPLPEYTWTSADGNRIFSTESFELKDFNRRLVVNMITAYTEFTCKMTNTAKQSPPRQETFYIDVVEKTNSSDIEFIGRKDDSTVKVLKPNQYKPFTMECHVKKKGDYQVLWLKNGSKKDWTSKDRIRIDVQREGPESEKEGVTIYFVTPNESDLGVYQCVVFGTEKKADSVKQQTTYITVEKDPLIVDSKSRRPNYQFLPGPFYVDEAAEACRAMNMHLVSILDFEENQIVLDLVRNNNAANVWIGLTREVPEPAGTWNWTLPGDPSLSFSNWAPGKPDNHYGNQEYAVLRNDTGKWEDVKRETWRRPAVCKNYTVACPSVDKFYEGRLRVRGWESTGTTYSVGQRVEVLCRYPKDKEFSRTYIITCGLDMNFDEPNMKDCLDHNSFFRSSDALSASNICFHVLVLCFLGTVFSFTCKS